MRRSKSMVKRQATRQRPLTAGALAKRSGASRATVHRYRMMGLLEVAGREGSQYLFTEESVPMMRLIRRLIGDEFGFRLEEVQHLILPKFTRQQLEKMANESAVRIKRRLQETGIPRVAEFAITAVIAKTSLEPVGNLGKSEVAALEEQERERAFAELERKHPGEHVVFTEHWDRRGPTSRLTLKVLHKSRNLADVSKALTEDLKHGRIKSRSEVASTYVPQPDVVDNDRTEFE